MGGKHEQKERIERLALAESKFVIGFAVAMLLAFLSMGYPVFYFYPRTLTQVPVYFARAADAVPFPPTLDRRNSKSALGSLLGVFRWRSRQ
jgi:hypothetical protein